MKKYLSIALFFMFYSSFIRAEYETLASDVPNTNFMWYHPEVYFEHIYDEANQNHSFQDLLAKLLTTPRKNSSPHTKAANIFLDCTIIFAEARLPQNHAKAINFWKLFSLVRGFEPLKEENQVNLEEVQEQIYNWYTNMLKNLPNEISPFQIEYNENNKPYNFDDAFNILEDESMWYVVLGLISYETLSRLYDDLFDYMTLNQKLFLQKEMKARARDKWLVRVKKHYDVSKIHENQDTLVKKTLDHEDNELSKVAKQYWGHLNKEYEINDTLAREEKDFSRQNFRKKIEQLLVENRLKTVEDCLKIVDASNPSSVSAEFFLKKGSPVFASQSSLVEFLDQFMLSQSLNQKDSINQNYDISIGDEGRLKKILFDYIATVKPNLSDFEEFLYFFTAVDAKRLKSLFHSELKRGQRAEVVLRELDRYVGMETIRKEFVKVAKRFAHNYHRGASVLPVQEDANNYVFVGAPGTGKTSIAKLFQRYLYELGIVSGNTFVTVSKTDLTSPVTGASAEKTKKILDDFRGGVIFVDESATLGDDDKGIEAINEINRWITESGQGTTIIFAGYQAEMRHLFSQNKGLESRFSRWFHFPSYGVPELKEMLKRSCAKERYLLSQSFEECAIDELSRQMKQQGFYFGNGRAVDELINDAIDELAMENNQSQELEGELAFLDLLEDRPLKNEDRHKITHMGSRHIKQWYGKINETALAIALEELDQLIGLAKVKERIKAMVSLARKNLQNMEERKEYVPLNLNMILTGNPGTGKTTVAGILGKIYKALGLLKSGDFVNIGRAEFVANYLGQTSSKTKKLLQGALDNVLFLDEAYELVQGGDKDYGQEALDQLVKYLSENNGRVAFITAGYEDRILKFLENNEGLRSRMGDQLIHFDDYSNEELWQIFVRKLQRSPWTLSGGHHGNAESNADEEQKDVEAKAKDILTQIVEMLKNAQEEKAKQAEIYGKRVVKQFGNARTMDNIFKKLILISEMRRNKEIQSQEEQKIASPDTIDLADIKELLEETKESLQDSHATEKLSYFM